MNLTISNAVAVGGALWGFALATDVGLKLPAQVPVHFGIDGNPDRFSGRFEAIVGLLIPPRAVLFVFALIRIGTVWLWFVAKQAYMNDPEQRPFHPEH
ncbi:MAG: DUF1648 domain-containing protein [Pirellulaceae bacterium]|nr:DUF1648 domain-containing protein [Pirellulaceae bacterium]